MDLNKKLSGISAIFFFIIIFFLMCGCGEQNGPVKQNTPKPLNSAESSTSQQEFIRFPDLGVMEVMAQALEGQVPTVVIRDANKKVLLQIKIEGKEYGGLENFTHRVSIEFKVLHIPGMPEPLLMVMAVEPGGSDAAWETILIGVVSGAIKRLWQQSEPLNYEGGILVGDLGQDRGTGVAQWNFVWGSGESHVDPHKYSLQLYLWNKQKSQFDVGPKYITKNKYQDDAQALQELGFNFRDQRNDFTRLRRY
jgi:hypothetical protein